MSLPPFTALETRSLLTTWSFRLKSPASSFLFAIAISSLFPWRLAPRSLVPQVHRPSFGRLTWALELQSAFASRVRQCLDAPVIKVSATVEHDLGDPFLLGALRHQFADLLGRGKIAAADVRLAVFRLAGLERGCRNQGHALGVVDYLRIDVA